MADSSKRLAVCSGKYTVVQFLGPKKEKMADGSKRLAVCSGK